MIDLADIFVALVLLAPDEAARALDTDYSARTRTACETAKSRQANRVELDWGAPVSAAAIATQPSTSDGKQFYIAWLKDRYRYNIRAFNTAYALEATSFTDLTEMDFRNVDRRRTAVAEDDRLFLEDLASTIQQRVDALLQDCAPGVRSAWKRNRT